MLNEGLVDTLEVCRKLETRLRGELNKENRVQLDYRS